MDFAEPPPPPPPPDGDALPAPPSPQPELPNPDPAIQHSNPPSPARDLSPLALGKSVPPTPLLVVYERRECGAKRSNPQPQQVTNSLDQAPWSVEGDPQQLASPMVRDMLLSAPPSPPDTDLPQTTDPPKPTKNAAKSVDSPQDPDAPHHDLHSHGSDEAWEPLVSEVQPSLQGKSTAALETENTVQDPPDSDVVSSPRKIDPALKAQVQGFLPNLAKDLQTLLHSRQRR